jgi:hypothetical protein
MSGAYLSGVQVGCSGFPPDVAVLEIGPSPDVSVLVDFDDAVGVAEGDAGMPALGADSEEQYPVSASVAFGTLSAPQPCSTLDKMAVWSSMDAVLLPQIHEKPSVGLHRCAAWRDRTSDMAKDLAHPITKVNSDVSWMYISAVVDALTVGGLPAASLEPDSQYFHRILVAGYADSKAQRSV